MERNFETVMIEQCAPVLASLKPAGLFRYETRDCADLARRVKNWNEQLQPKGLRVRVLKGCARTHQYLVYVYRESMLRAVLTDETVQGFLRQEGYHLPAERADCTAWLTQLSRRLCCSAEFPHEIGVFLGYPLSDVVGFIENSGRNFTCCGCWKAYGDTLPKRCCMPTSSTRLDFEISTNCSSVTFVIPASAVVPIKRICCIW